MTKIKIAHSPDTDDRFMFYALKEKLIPTPDWQFEIVAKDIGILNVDAKDAVYDITALSFHAYAHVQEHYALLSSGASMAEKNYGPLLVAKHPTALHSLQNKSIAVPGLLSTATLLLKMILPDFQAVPMQAHLILDAVAEKQVDAGLIIHEGQIHYTQKQLHVVTQIMDAWKQLSKSDLPLPLGCSAVKKSLGQTQMQTLARLQKQSIAYAFAHRDLALDYARKAAPQLSRIEADHYLQRYANARTLHLGVEEKEAIGVLFDLAHAHKLVAKPVTLEIIEG